MVTDPRFSTVLGRKDNENMLDAFIQEWTFTRTAEDVMVQMQTAGVPAGVVETAQDQLDYDPQLKHRGFFRELEFPGVGEYHTSLGANFLLSKYKFEPARGPLVGEHNDYVFKDILGLPQSEYDQLVAEKVIY